MQSLQQPQSPGQTVLDSLTSGAGSGPAQSFYNGSSLEPEDDEQDA
jgi:hypothetical protein